MSWGCGYLGLWMSKFFVATIFTDENIIKHGWDSIRHRLYGYHVPDVDWNFAWALENSFNEYAKIVNVWIVCLFAVAFLGCVIFSKVSFRKSYIVAVNILIGLYPFVWCLIVQNHSIEHSGSVYRIFTISILAIGFLLSCCIKDGRCFENENVENK